MASMKDTKTTNQVLFDTIRDLVKYSNKTGLQVWRAVARDLSSSASQRSQVNLGHIDKCVENDEVIIVPGKVLGDGIFNKKITIVAFGFTASAILKMEKAGTKYFKINEYLKKNPDGKIRILG